MIKARTCLGHCISKLMMNLQDGELPRGRTASDLMRVHYKGRVGEDKVDDTLAILLLHGQAAG
jgi:hypothetical protein